VPEDLVFVQESNKTVTQADLVSELARSKSPSLHVRADDASSIKSNHTSKSERSSIGDWMGTWWVKGTRRNSRHRPAITYPVAQEDTEDAEVSVKDLLKDTPHVDTPVTPRPNFKSRHKSSRSVFGTLGVSILNPAPASSSSKSHVSEVSGPDPPDVVIGAAAPIGHTSPILPAAPQLTTTHLDALSYPALERSTLSPSLSGDNSG
jgi:hypothetical protein